MKTIVLVARFDEDPSKASKNHIPAIEFCDKNGKVTAIGYLMPIGTGHQFMITPSPCDNFIEYDFNDPLNFISGYSYIIDNIALTSSVVFTSNREDIKSETIDFRKKVFYGLIQDGLRDYEHNAFIRSKQKINVIIENGFNDNRKIIEESAVYRYIDFYYEYLKVFLGDMMPPVHVFSKGTMRKLEEIERDNSEKEEEKEEKEEIPNHNEFVDEQNQAYIKPDDPDKELNYRFE